jgi:general secretion pathway protein A
MYLKFYGLNKEPFSITPDPAFLFLSPSHKEALAAVIYGVEKRKGFIVITGEVGLGKTTILRSYLEQTSKERLKTVYLFNTNVSFPALLKTIFRELDLPVVTDEPGEMLRQLHQFLIKEYQLGCNIVLVIDEAQSMPLETLENIRMLSNLETSTDKMIQIVFSGQPEFDQLLDLNELRQLKQRIAVRTTIAPLTTKESSDYISYRLAMAGNKDEVIFTPGALKRILRHARGIPRVLNILCDNALITAFGYQKKKVNRAIAGEIIRDFAGKKVLLNRVWWISIAALLLIAFSLGLVRLSAPPVVNRTAEKSPENLPVQAVKNKIELPKKVTVTPPPVVTHTIEKSPENFPVQAIKNKIKLPKKVTVSPPPPAKGTFPVTKVVKSGDTLLKMVEDVYGYRNQKLVELVQQHNNKIKNTDKILVGDKIKFPVIMPEKH